MNHIKKVNEFKKSEILSTLKKLIVDSDDQVNQIAKTKEVVVEKDYINFFKETTENFSKELFEGDPSEEKTQDVIAENISLIQYLFLDKKLKLKEILENESEYFDHNPFKIIKDTKTWDILTSLDSDVTKREDDLNDFSENLLKKSATKKELRKLKKIAYKTFGRDKIKKFIDSNKDEHESVLYDTLFGALYVYNINKKFSNFFANENYEKYQIVDTSDSEQGIETDKDGGTTFATKAGDLINKAKTIGTVATTGLAGVMPKMSYGKTGKLTPIHKKHIKQLHPEAQDDFEKLFSKILSMGYNIRVTSSYRTFKHQARLKKQNKSNAKAGYSPHNYGFAMDLNIISPKGKWYKKATSKEDWQSTGIPQIARKLGFRWGGDFKTYHDPVHFDIVTKKRYNTTNMLNLGKEQYGEDPNFIKGNKIKIT